MALSTTEKSAVQDGAVDSDTSDTAVDRAEDGGGNTAESYPEGGTEAWLVVTGAWLALFASLGVMNSMATFQTYVSAHQLADETAGKVGWIFSMYAFMSFFTGIYIGPVFDKYGPRWLVVTGSLLMTVSLVLLSISKVYWHFMLTFGVLAGTASALLFTPSIASIGHFFRQRRGLATGVAQTGSGIGGVCIPLVMQRLFDRVGWGWAVRSLALICLVFSGAAAALLRSRLPPKVNASVHPDPRIFRQLPFLLATIFVFLFEFALFTPLTYISDYALSRGFSGSFAADMVTAVNAASVAGRLVSGFYADRIGPFNTNMLAVALSVLACLAVWLPGSLLGQTLTSAATGGDSNSRAAAPLVIYALLFGFTSGCNISLAPVSIGRLCETAEYGRYYATCFTVVSVASLVGIPIAGVILESNGGRYWGMVVYTAALYMGAFVAVYAAKGAAVGWKWKTIF